jgi:hypothetical protein
MACYANQAPKAHCTGLASHAAARSATAHQQREAELCEVQGICASPCCQQREHHHSGISVTEDVQVVPQDVEPSQLIEQSQSLLSPEIPEEPESSQQSGESLTVEHVNVEMQLPAETGLFDRVDDDEEDDNVGSMKRSTRGGENENDDDDDVTRKGAKKQYTDVLDAWDDIPKRWWLEHYSIVFLLAVMVHRKSPTIINAAANAMLGPTRNVQHANAAAFVAQEHRVESVRIKPNNHCLIMSWRQHSRQHV